MEGKKHTAANAYPWTQRTRARAHAHALTHMHINEATIYDLPETATASPFRGYVKTARETKAKPNATPCVDILLSGSIWSQ